MASWSSKARSALPDLGGEVEEAEDLRHAGPGDAELAGEVSAAVDRRVAAQEVLIALGPDQRRTGDRRVALRPHPDYEPPAAPHACLVDRVGVPPGRRVVRGAVSGKHGEFPANSLHPPGG